MRRRATQLAAAALTIGLVSCFSTEKPKPPQSVTHVDDQNHFDLTYPSTWHVVTSSVSPLVFTIASRTSDASVTVSLVPMRVPLVSDWDDTFRVGEEDRVKQLHPDAVEVSSKISQTAPLPRGVLVEYKLPKSPSRDLVKQLSVPIVGTTDRYYLISTVREASPAASGTDVDQILKSFHLRAH